MPTITGQAIPPELAALYAALTSPGKVAQGADGTLRLKKGKKKPKKEPRDNIDLRAFYDLANQLKDEIEAATGVLQAEDFAYTIVQELIVGYINPEYFRKCRVIEAVTLQSVPSGVVDPDPPPYGFRTELFMPTIPTYPDGEPSALTPRYMGEKIGAHFYDTLLVWRKIAFDADSLTHPAGAKRVLFQWNTTITIAATSRGSRPMYSRNVRAYICNQTGSALTNTKPPISAKTSLYWRFKLPPASPPFFNTTQLVRYTIPFARIAKNSGSGAPYCYLVNASNRPMMGRGYNNNDQVETHLDTDPELWEIRRCIGKTADTWGNAAAVAQNYWYGVCWSPALSLFCAVAYAGATVKFMTSPDGIHWTGRQTPLNKGAADVIWVPELALFVAVMFYASNGAVMTSPDGITWTVRTAPTAYDWQNICWSPQLGLLLVLSREATEHAAMTSPDGINWTLNTGIPTGYWEDLCWSPELGLFCAVGTNDYAPHVMTSADGINWNTPTTEDAFYWQAVAWSPELGIFCALGSGYGDTDIMTSPDGINWTRTKSPLTAPIWGLEWSSELGLFCAVGNSNNGHSIRTSPDGLNWTEHTHPAVGWYGAVCWAPELCRFVAVAYYGASYRVAYSV